MSGADIRRVGIVGGGQMGAGIAEVCARAGLDTLLCEATGPAATAARERIAVSLERAVQRGKLDRTSAEAALARITTTAELTDLADRQLVVEAVTRPTAPAPAHGRGRAAGPEDGTRVPHVPPGGETR